MDANALAIVISAAFGAAGVIYTAWKNNQATKKFNAINTDLGGFASKFAPAADTAEQFTVLNKALYTEIERLTGELDKERSRATSRESQLLGELEVERAAKIKLLEQVQQLRTQVGDFQRQVADLETKVKAAISGTGR